MTRIRMWCVGACLLLLAATSVSQAGWRVGIGIGLPAYGYPYYPRYYYPYYPPPPAVIVAPPVQVVPAPSVQVVPAPPTTVAPSPSFQPPAPTPAPDDRQGEIDRQLLMLRDPGEQVRADAAMALGRMHADRAIDPLAATLSGDSSPKVREAAARALGLLGSQKALPALQRAAQADGSRDVRSSAQYSIDVVNSR
jgi:hypothetical protein